MLTDIDELLGPLEDGLGFSEGRHVGQIEDVVGEGMPSARTMKSGGYALEFTSRFLQEELRTLGSRWGETRGKLGYRLGVKVETRIPPLWKGMQRAAEKAKWVKVRWW